MNRARIYRWTRMRRYIERSSDAGPSSLRLFCLGCIIATRGYDFREGQAITFSQTLGTALGDWIADTGGLGYEGGALIFAAGLAAIVALYFWTNTSRALLFRAAFILT